MPNRILHERICVSETIAMLTSDEERFFYRLIVQCDDYGRFDGRASVIRARCFPLQIDEVDDEDVSRWLSVMERVGLVQTYAVEGRAFLRVTTWERHQQTRAKRSKYPAPEDDLPASDSNGYQALAHVPEKREARSEKREAISEKTDTAAPPSPPPEIKPLEVPEALASFHEVLSSAQGYAPTETFFAAVTERYGSLDLREQALKMASWLADPKANKRRQRATQRFVLDWLKRESTGPPARAPTRNGSSQHKPEIERMPVVVRRY